MLGDLRDKLEPLGRLDVLDSVGSRALAYYQRQDKSELSDEALAQRSKALTLMGEVANARGDLDGALRRYQEALAGTAEAVRRYPDDPQRLFDHAQNVFWVGYIAYQRGQVGGGVQPLQRIPAPRQPDGRARPRQQGLPARGNLRQQQPWHAAHGRTPLRRGGARFRSGAAPGGNPGGAEPKNLDYQKQVGANLAWLADAHEYSGELDQALAERERQLRILGSVGQLQPLDQRDAMTAHYAMGRLLASRGQAAAG